MMAPIHIIGAGLLGLSTADSLIERGCDVVIWDAQPAPGMGASFRNSAMVHPSQAKPWRIEGFSDDCTGKTTNGMTRAALDLARVSQARMRCRTRQLGLPVNPSNVHQIFASRAMRDERLAELTHLGVSVHPTLWNASPGLRLSHDEVVDAGLYTLSLAEDLVMRGAEFRLGEAVSLSLRDSVIVISSSSHQHVADHVVVAAGAASPDLLRPLSIDLPLKGIAGHALSFARPNTLQAGTAIMDAESRSALTVLDHEVRLSGSVGLSSPDDLLPIWSALAPHVIEALGSPTARWTGYRPVSSHGRPIMEESAVKGLYLNTGHAHMGWTQCAGAGEVVADLITGRSTG